MPDQRERAIEAFAERLDHDGEIALHERIERPALARPSFTRPNAVAAQIEEHDAKACPHQAAGQPVARPRRKSARRSAERVHEQGRAPNMPLGLEHPRLERPARTCRDADALDLGRCRGVHGRQSTAPYGLRERPGSGAATLSAVPGRASRTALCVLAASLPGAALGADGSGGAPSPILRECLAAAPASRAGPWQRARASQLTTYCDELARALASLDADPARARAAAERAEGLLPGRAAPLLLQGQASTREGKYEQAVALFRRAAERDALALDDPRSLYDFARALEEAEGQRKALETYRRLAPLASSLPGEERAQALVGAALASSARGPESVDESLALVRSALQEGPPSLRPVLQAVLALSLDRRGARAEATQAAERARRAGALGWLEDAKRGGDEWVAVRARLLEAADLSAAATLWQAFLRGPGGRGPWAAHARARLADLPTSSPPKKP